MFVKGLVAMLFFILLRELLSGKKEDEMKRGKKKAGIFGDGATRAERRAVHFARQNATKPRKPKPMDDVKLPEAVAIPEWKG